MADKTDNNSTLGKSAAFEVAEPIVDAAKKGEVISDIKKGVGVAVSDVRNTLINGASLVIGSENMQKIQDATQAIAENGIGKQPADVLKNITAAMIDLPGTQAELVNNQVDKAVQAAGGVRKAEAEKDLQGIVHGYKDLNPKEVLHNLNQFVKDESASALNGYLNKVQSLDDKITKAIGGTHEQQAEKDVHAGIQDLRNGNVLGAFKNYLKADLAKVENIASDVLPSPGQTPETAASAKPVLKR